MQRPVTAHISEKPQADRRRGTIAVMAAFLLIPLMAMLAFAIDYGYLLKKKTELQRSADAAALAAVRELVPNDNGNQDLNAVRAKVREYARANMGDANFAVLDADIQIGRYDTSSVYSNFTILNNGTFDTVRVTLRHDNSANSPVSLFFAKVLGFDSSSVTATATAVLPKATVLEPGADILPFAVHEDVWNSQSIGDEWSIYGDGRIEDEIGQQIPGNWGTVDIGPQNNSTSDLSDQIRNGLRQSDVNALYNDGRISTNTHIDATQSWDAQADTGLSAGLKHAVQDVHGLIRLVPIYDQVSGNGNNAEFRIIAWGVVRVVDSGWQGNNKHVTIKKSYTYNASSLRPHSNLGNTTGVIQGAYTTPLLVQ